MVEAWVCSEVTYHRGVGPTFDRTTSSERIAVRSDQGWGVVSESVMT